MLPIANTAGTISTLTSIGKAGVDASSKQSVHYKRTKAKAAGLVLFFALKLITIARRVVRRMYSPGGSGYAIARAHFYHTATAPPHSLL